MKKKAVRMMKSDELGGMISRKLDEFEVFLKSERAKEATIKTYLPIIARFLEGCDGLDDVEINPDEADARTFLADQYDKAGNTARKMFYALRTYFRSRNVQFNLNPPKPTEHPFKPTLNDKQMSMLITTIKDQGDAREKGIGALSSVYAIRRKELIELSRNDVNFEDRTITIRAVKGGRERVHLIPDIILSHISNYDFKPISYQTAANVFWGMVRKAMMELPKGYGFHSIRRALNVGLRQRGVDILLRHEFMRWRFRDPSIIDMIYETTPAAEIDRIVFEKHPFLEAWA